MELPHLGLNCQVCNRNDYLPFKCTHCDKMVCIDHKTNHGKDCPLEATHFEPSDVASNLKNLQKSCDFCKKMTLELELTECGLCRSRFCLHHRHQDQHNCSLFIQLRESTRREAEQRHERQRIALQNLKGVPSTSGSCITLSETAQRLPSDPKKRALAKRVRIMKIKQTARGPPNILEVDRVYFEVKFHHEPGSKLSDVSKQGRSVNIFTTLKHPVGRMIDWSAGELGLTNKNNVPGSSQLVFRKLTSTDEWITLDNQVDFSHYLNDDTLENGDEIILTFSVA